MNLRTLISSPSRPTFAPERVLYFGSTLAVVAIIAIVGFLLVRERSNVELAAGHSAANLVQLINNDVLRNAELYNTALEGMISAIHTPDFNQLPLTLQRQALFDRAITVPFRGDLIWVNAAGDVVADSMEDPPRLANFANDPTFIAHRKSRNPDLFVSPPFKDHLGTLGWCVSFSRRISSDDGQFMGVASGALRLSYFNDLFKSLKLSSDGNVTLLSLDGTVLARQPEVRGRDLIGQDLSHRPNFQRFLNGDSGSFTGLSSQDHSHRLYTYARVGDLPMLVVVALSSNDVYASWKRTAQLVSGATLVLCLTILWLTLLLRRELHLRQSAERELATLAATDSLTGLANRRSLDHSLQREWSRALRSGEPMSVLMIDVDHFKSFNERHGHQGGDEALRNVAAAIHSSIRRPSDLAARYGGEEFLVILPDTDLKGARMIAEAIRVAVEQQPPYGKDVRPVTVSIGIGSQRIRAGRTVQGLFSEADAALYQAKHRGRNQVAHSDARLE